MSVRTVLSVASEAFPLVKTGGLGDVVGALPIALTREGIATTTLLPGYASVMDALKDAVTVREYDFLQGAPARLLAGRAAGLDLLVLDSPHLFARPGNPYVAPDGTDWPDNAQRFAALGAAAADVARGAVAGFAPDIVQAHDWQAALAVALLHYSEGRRPGTVMTVHNLAFQGKFPRELLEVVGLPPRAYAADGVEYYGDIGYLKAGLALADRITTVSPTYAAEIRSAEHGMGLDGLLRHRTDALTGILNGIDTDVWNPATDAHLAASYDARRLGRRTANRMALQARMDLALDPDALLVGVVSRLTWQKGLDLLPDVLPALIAQGGQLALLGSGDFALEAVLQEAAAAHPDRIAVTIGYDESLAHQIQGGVDALLVPSRFEPCGLTQLCALRYGAVPVVAHAGGLADTVIDANEMAVAANAGTGVVFAPDSRHALDFALERVAKLRRDPRSWQQMQRRGMKTDVSWARPAAQYAALFRALAASRAV
ncbi:MAG: glycogen synthase GlgA [Gemmatimonadaceae bacterium]|nr:glycogen synthase GlgA [Gemmatimonadaceae bacterium]